MLTRRKTDKDFYSMWISYQLLLEPLLSFRSLSSLEDSIPDRFLSFLHVQSKKMDMRQKH